MYSRGTSALTGGENPGSPPTTCSVRICAESKNKCGVADLTALSSPFANPPRRRRGGEEKRRRRGGEEKREGRREKGGGRGSEEKREGKRGRREKGGRRGSEEKREGKRGKSRVHADDPIEEENPIFCFALC